MNFFRRVKARIVSDESGMTVPELIIYAISGAIIASLLGVYLIMSINSSKEVNSQTLVTSKAQVLASSLTNDIRNSSKAYTKQIGDTYYYSLENKDLNNMGLVTCKVYAFSSNGTVYKADNLLKADVRNITAAKTDFSSWGKVIDASASTEIHSESKASKDGAVNYKFKVSDGISSSVLQNSVLIENPQASSTEVDDCELQ